MTKHTPGPWKVKDYKNSGLAVCQEIDSQEVICWSAGTKMDMSRDRLANAHLIAAAPELLESLKDVLPTLTNTVGGTATTQHKMAEKAIAKAEGHE